MAYTPMIGLLAALSVAAPAPEEKPPQTDQSTMSTQDVDGYLFERYLETPKFDKKDFTSKDPKAAALLDMTLEQYVIGGMDKSFRQKLYVAFKAMEEAGLNPGITSGFRDNYRQQLIISGVRAKVGNSFHGGSSHGGYGHGLAVDIVSLDGKTRAEQQNYSEKLWRWIDKFGRQLGLIRPYPNFDDPHVAPVTSEEAYVHGRRVAHAGKHKHHRFAKHGKHGKHFAGHKSTVRG